LQSAWELGQKQPLPDSQGITRIIISGLGGSAIGADLLAATLAPDCRIPVIVQRDCDLPSWAYGRATLVIASSHSSDTEETLAVFEAAIRAKCRLMAVCTGEELEQRAAAHHLPVWKFTHAG
jgi:glucose/mannose-6-phosphate isomerase